MAEQFIMRMWLTCRFPVVSSQTTLLTITIYHSLLLATEAPSISTARIILGLTSLVLSIYRGVVWSRMEKLTSQGGLYIGTRYNPLFLILILRVLVLRIPLLVCLETTLQDPLILSSKYLRLFSSKHNP